MTSTSVTALGGRFNRSNLPVACSPGRAAPDPYARNSAWPPRRISLSGKFPVWWHFAPPLDAYLTCGWLMPKPISPRRCPLARLEAALARDAQLDGDLKLLASSLIREARRETPGAGKLLRMVQAVAIAAYIKSQTTDPGLVVLTRSLDALIRSLRALGLLQFGRRGAQPEGRKRGDIFSEVRQAVPADDEQDEGESGGEEPAGDETEDNQPRGGRKTEVTHDDSR